MKILMVNKFHYIKGGSETYYFALKRLLEAKGHTVIDFSMEDERNFPSEYSSYFVRNADYSGGGSALEKLRIAKNIIYSGEAKRKFKKIVEDFRPDLVHLQIFQHQISPSILDVIKKYKIPTVYTAHDLKMICLNYKLMHHGKICEDCKDGKLRHCVKNRCVKNSKAKSLINLCEGALHRFKKSYDAIGAIITPSSFYSEKFIEFGVEPDRLVHIPNFLDSDLPTVNRSADSESYFLYFGRLSEEKGVMTLIRASAGLPIYIVGTGPLEKELGDYIKNNNLTNIKMLGFKSGQELYDLVGNAKAVVLPSEWYENGPYSAIEALALSRPIIGADIGGIPELIRGNGLLFQSGNAEELGGCLKKLYALSPEEYAQMKNNSRRLFSEEYTPEIHYKKLSEVYRMVRK